LDASKVNFDVNQMLVFRYEELYVRNWNCPDGACVIPGTKGYPMLQNKHKGPL